MIVTTVPRVIVDSNCSPMQAALILFVRGHGHVAHGLSDGTIRIAILSTLVKDNKIYERTELEKSIPNLEKVMEILGY